MDASAAEAVPGGTVGDWCPVHGTRTLTTTRSGLSIAQSVCRPYLMPGSGGVDSLGDVSDVVGLATAGLSAGGFVLRRKLAAKRRARLEGLSGDWWQYHPTQDSAVSSSKIWVEHSEKIRVKRGRIMGKSENHHSTKLRYAIEGELIDGEGPSFRYQNRVTDEAMVAIRIDLDHRPDLMIGSWTGEDFDGQPNGGRILYSRMQLSTKRLKRLLKQYPRRCCCHPAA